MRLKDTKRVLCNSMILITFLFVGGCLVSYLQKCDRDNLKNDKK